MSTFKLFDYKCGLALEGRDMGLRRDMSSWCDNYLCLVTLKSLDASQMYRPDKDVCTLKTNCDKVKLQNVSVTLTLQVGP
jgi:hypothetical protein